MLNLSFNDKVLFYYFNPKTGEKEKLKGSIRSETKHKDGYVVSFMKENEKYIGDKKNNKKMFHNYYLTEENFIGILEKW